MPTEFPGDPNEAIRAVPRAYPSAAEAERESLRYEGEMRAKQQYAAQYNIKNAGTTAELLAERGKVHGPWEIDSWCCQQMTVAFIQAARQTDKAEIPAPIIQAIQMTLVKIARMAAGDIFEPDHYRDAIGYLTLALNYITSTKR